MSCRWLISVAISSVAVIFWGCFESGAGPHAGGTIETTNGITAMVMRPDGVVASNTKVYLLNEKEWVTNIINGNSIVIDSAVTNDSGVFKFNVDSGTVASIMASDGSNGFLIREVSQQRLNKEYWGKISMRALVTYNGVIMDSLAASKQVLLAGTPFSADVDESTGGFSLKSVPQQHYSVLIRSVKADGSEVFFVADEVELDGRLETQVDTIVPTPRKFVLLDDFEDRDNRNSIGPLLGGGYWDAYSDEYVGGSSKLLMPLNAAPLNFSSAILNEGGERGKALKVLYTEGGAGLDKPYPFVTVELNLGGSDIHYNLSAFDTLSFFARGTGNLVIELIQNPIKGGYPLHVVAMDSVALTADWGLVSITPDNLRIIASVFPDAPEKHHAQFLSAKLPLYIKKPESWQEMGGMIRSIRFIGTGGSEFQLDHIRLDGINLGDMVK